MGSGAETAHETVDWMVAKGEKVGMLKVRLYRPFAIRQFIAALPKSVKSIAVLDRTKEPGALGEPLYLDVLAALREAKDAGFSPFAADPQVIGGRYGLSSKEFTPACVKAVFDELAKPAPKAHFTVGIVDDVTHLSLPVDPEFDIEPDDVVRGVFFGLGSDGTVGREQELDQDHRRGDGERRAGLLRLRLEEGRRGHHLAPALRAAQDPLDAT